MRKEDALQQARAAGRGISVLLLGAIALASMLVLLVPTLDTGNSHGGGLQAAAVLAFVTALRGLHLSWRGRHHLATAVATLAMSPMLYLLTRHMAPALLLGIGGVVGIGLEWLDARHQRMRRRGA